MTNANSSYSSESASVPVLELSGTASEIGRCHGETFAERIGQTVEVYTELFRNVGKLTQEQVRERAQGYGPIIQASYPAYYQEIVGIAEGAGLALSDILTINARTEILTTLVRSAAECTLICFSKAGILAQTWDWLKGLENKPILLKIRADDGHSILTMTEPGMIGKIGINSVGLGVGLNILVSSERAEGCPVHVLLRAALDARSWDQAYETLARGNTGTNSAITLASDRGECVTFEYMGGRVGTVPPLNGVLLHTNHYLSLQSPSTIIDSIPRFNRAQDLLQQLSKETVDSAMSLLSDRAEHGSICVPWKDEGEFGYLGTVLSTVFDLKQRKIFISQGSPASIAHVLPGSTSVALRYDQHVL